MATGPDMIVQFAHHLAERWKAEYNAGQAEAGIVSRVKLPSVARTYR